jgi:hypothetical protein
MYEKMMAADPKRNAIYNAFDELKTEGEIVQFCTDYIAFMKVHPEYGKYSPFELLHDIGYVLGQMDRKTSDLWTSSVPLIVHPIYGKDIPFSSDEDLYDAATQLLKAKNYTFSFDGPKDAI